VAISGKTLIDHFEAIALPRLAVDKDRIGLQLGSLEREVTGVLVALEVTEKVIEEAIEVGANWIFSHHALIYQPLAQVRMDQPVGRMIEKLIQHQIQVYVAHTNLDAAKGGVNDVLAEEIGLIKTKTFLTHGQEQLIKLVVFVPSTHVEVVRKAMGDNGAGAIGNYSHCTFVTSGKGTFLPQAGTNPYIGEKGKVTEVDEYRLETIVPVSLKQPVIKAMLAVHPYEEVAYDLYPLAMSLPIGMGKIGLLPEAILLKEFVQQVKIAYDLTHVRVVGDIATKVQTVALLGGAGSRYVADAKRLGADVYLTGDIDYHTAQAALQERICLIDLGHHVEQRVLPAVCQQLEKKLNGEVPVYTSWVDFNPFQIC
jgi:dinuclear metal center YbgI/SA1388 family protein